MLDKIKAFAETVKGVLLYIVTPLAFIAGYIWILLGKQRGLEDKIADLTRDERVKEQQTKIEGDERDVEKSTGDYTRLRDQYLSEHGASGELPGSDQGGGSDDSGKGQDDKGS